MIKDTFKNRNTWIFALYVFIYAIFFTPMLKGVGNYWDWTFPYFKEQLPNIFLNQSLSWTNLNLGSPLSYSSDYFFRFLIFLFSFLRLNPEILLFILILLLFSIGSFGVFLISKNKLNTSWSFIFGLVAFINPAIFYKLLAGHTNYLVSYVVFIYFVYYLLFRFQKNFKSAIILGLIFAFIGAQLQFFIFAFLFLVLYVCFNRNKFYLKYFLIICFVPILINIFWLLNFITGVVSLQETSEIAAKGSFSSSNMSNFINVFDLSFSNATQISKFYNIYWQSFFIFFFVFLIIYWLKIKSRNKNNIFLFSFALILMILSTGFFHNFQFFPINIFYPMLREVGHFAPLIILTLILLVISIKERHRFIDTFFFVFLILFLIINSYTFYNYCPKLNFIDTREQFLPFYQFNNEDNSNFRILTYPFFNQYSFKNVETKKKNGVLLNNCGWDSFIIFSGKDFINNAVTPDKFKDSIQYKLLKDYDVENLKKYNVKYIYNFSDIYESNYEKYVPAYVYDNDLSLIKNDKEFFNKLIAKNPDKLNKISDNILEIRDYLPRIYSLKNVFEFYDENYKYENLIPNSQLNFKNPEKVDFEIVNPTKKIVHIKRASTPFFLVMGESYHPDWKLMINNQKIRGAFNSWMPFVKPDKISDDNHLKLDKFLNIWYVDVNELRDRGLIKQNQDGTYDIEMVVEFWPQRLFFLGLIISGLTLLSCFGYLGYDWRRKKKIKKVNKNYERNK